MLAILGPVLTGIAFLFVVLRVIARQPSKNGLFGWDDAIIVLSWIIGMPVAVIDGFFHKNGLGRDVWTVPADDITRLLRLFYMAEIFYLLCTVTTKLALLIFFLRVFPNTGFRAVTRGLIWVCGAFCLGFLVPLIFQCWPVSYAWLRWDGEHHGSCINVYAGIFAHAAINMVLDLVILILPMPILIKLRTSYFWRQKVHVLIMFSFGVIVTIVSVLRLNALIPLRDSVNPTWDYWGSAVWSVVEQEVGIICACLPAAKIVLARFLPSWLGLMTDASRSGVQSPGPYAPANHKHLPRPGERAPVAVQGGNGGFTELEDVGAPVEQWRSKAMLTTEELPRTLSAGEISEHWVPVSTKQWS